MAVSGAGRESSVGCRGRHAARCALAAMIHANRGNAN
jgi:hypothetical protein